MTNLFTYGSLMCDDIMLHVSGQMVTHQKAHLNDFFCSQIHGERYPGITQAVGQRVEGVLYFNLNHEALIKLDSFEGEYYERQEITVHCSQGEIGATAYIIKPQYHHLLTGNLWNYEDFLRNGKKEFETNYVGFTQI